MSIEPLETAYGSDYPCCRQLSVFLDNRVGQLLRLTRLLDGADIRILALTVESSIDCAIVRLLVDKPDEAGKMITDARFAVSETELVVVELPPGKRGILTACQALIVGEVNIHYTYPLLAARESIPTLAFLVDNHELAVAVLRSRKFKVLDQSEL